MLTFAWPWMLLALAVVPVVVLWYRRLLRARAVRRAELAALGLAGPTPLAGWRRTLPPALLLGALVLLLAALARPEIGVPLPRREGTVMLAFDVSSSMTATDLTPTRMDAAKAAARTVVERQPPTCGSASSRSAPAGSSPSSRPGTARACSPRSTASSPPVVRHWVAACRRR
jgi:Ca-activated chloride channel family protein